MVAHGYTTGIRSGFLGRGDTLGFALPTNSPTEYRRLLLRILDRGGGGAAGRDLLFKSRHESLRAGQRQWRPLPHGRQRWSTITGTETENETGDYLVFVVVEELIRCRFDRISVAVEVSAIVVFRRRFAVPLGR